MRNVIYSLLLVVATLAAGNASAQIKLGHINTATLIEKMPDVTKAQDSLKIFNEQMQKQYQVMADEFQKKLDDYQKSQAATNPSIREIREKELQDMQTRIQGFEQTAQEGLGKERERLMTPIMKKVQDAITAVATEGKYNYVLDSTQGGGVLYALETQDITDKVKAKLGIK